MAELVDALDSKSGSPRRVWVQVPLRPPEDLKKEGGVPHISNAGPTLITYDYTIVISQNQEFYRLS